MHDQDRPPRRNRDTAALNQWGRARLRLIRTPSTITGNWWQLRGCPFAATLQAKAGIAGIIVDRFLSNT